MVEWSEISGQCGLPCIATPQESSGRETSSAALTAWVTKYPQAVTEKLMAYGAVLFRGFSFDGIEAFDGLANAFCPTRQDYIGGNSPRIRIRNGVYTATEYPNGMKISLHNEASYLRSMPRYIIFYCATPPKRGGQTPLADCRKIFRGIDPSIRERFVSKRIKYVHNLHGGHGFGRSWRDVFQTEDKREIEQWLEMRGYEFSWKADGGLRTSIVGDGAAKHPETNEDVWINQAEQWHPSSLDPRARNALLSLLKEEDLPHNACFGDGTPLTEAELDHIRQVLAEQEVVFEWAEKDVLICDNYLVAHGRQPFTGERKILVTLGG
jgi:alpha-ketoglutarate-dependent taurine dioxygenase